jgi:hypothetical protein
LDVPSDFEGSVMRELFEPGFLAGREVRVGAPTSLDAVASKGKLADAEEEELILSRLRALGYVN